MSAPKVTRFHVQLNGQHTFTEDDIWGLDEAFEGGGIEAVKEIIMEDWTSFLEEFIAEGGALTDLFLITPIDPASYERPISSSAWKGSDEQAAYDKWLAEQDNKR